MISVVVPVLNEESNVEPLLREIVAVSAHAPITEIVYIDDGSTDATPEILAKLKKDIPILRVLRHEARSGQSAALWTGIGAATQDLVVTLDGDGQNDPADIVLLYRAYQDNAGKGARIMVAGQRKKRNDSWVKRISSRLANRIRSGLLKDKTRDTGCSLKLYRRADYLALPYFNHMHRFLPALMLREGVGVVHVDVSHRPRERGVSKYGTLDRLKVGIADLLGVRWLQARGPSHVRVQEQ